MACAFVPTDSGLFCAGWSRQEVVDALKLIDTALKTMVVSTVGNLTSASLNGKSFTFGTNTTTGVSTQTELTNKKNDLLKGLYLCDGKYPPAMNRATAVFFGKVYPPMPPPCE